MNKLQGGMMVVSRWMEKDVLKGFLLAGTDYKLHMLPLEVIQANGYLIPYLNAQYDANYQTLVGTHGDSLTDYPAVNSDYVLVKANGIIVMSTIIDADTKKPLGVVAFNGMGTRFNLTYKKLIELSNKYRCCNFKMVSDSKYGNIAVRKDGSYFDTVEIVSPQAAAKDSDNHSCVQSAPGELPVLGVYNLESMRDCEFNQSAQEKLVLTMANMNKLTPYYYVILQAIRRKPAPIGTMGVTEDTLFYDQAFVSNLKVPELTFVLIHEIMHLAMQHSSRFGARTNPQMWNIATDLYINSIICHDFGVTFGGGPVDFKNLGSIKTPDFGVYIETIGMTIDLSVDTPETIYNRLMKENMASAHQPSGGSSSSGNKGSQSNQQQIKEAIEQIKKGLEQIKQGAQRAQQEANNGNGSKEASQQIAKGMQEIQNAMDAAKAGQQQQVEQSAQSGMQNTQSGVNNMNQASKAGQQGQKGQQPGQSQGQQGQQPGQSQGQQPGQQPGQQGQGQGQMSSADQMQRGLNQVQQGLSKLVNAGRPQPQQGQAGQGQSSNQGRSGGSSSDSDKSQNQGQGQSTQQQSSLAEDDFGASGDYSPMQEVSVTYNGKKLTGTIMRDVMTKNASKSKDAVQDKLDASRKAIQTIDTKLKMEEQERGEPLEKNAGMGAGLVKRYIEVGLSAGVDWRVIFRNICKDKPKKTFTLAQPNQDYMNLGMTLADRRRIGKPEQVSKVKFAIDVSGSVSKKELMITLSEINNIFNYFKMDGELIYWSTMIGDAGNFSSLKDMLKINPVTTGGTDVRCVFDYLAGKTKVHGKTEKERVRDMKAIFIITDGCFSMNFDDYKEMFGRRVVWLITGVRGNIITFNPPFGRVLTLNIDND